MSDNTDIRSLLSSLLRSSLQDEDDRQRQERADRKLATHADDVENPLAYTELYTDEAGNSLPTKLHILPLYGRPILPTQILTVQLSPDRMEVLTEVIASTHHCFALFAVPEEKAKNAGRNGEIPEKDLPEVGTMVRLLSAKTSADGIDIVCEGLKRVSILHEGKIGRSPVDVHYPEIEYALANPTVQDKLKANANVLRKTLQKSGEFAGKLNELKRKAEDYAASIGLRAVYTNDSFIPEFYLIKDGRRIGRISLGKLDLLLKFAHIELNEEEKYRLACSLALPDRKEYEELEGYLRQISRLADENRNNLHRNLLRIAPKTAEIARSLISDRSEEQKETKADTNKAPAQKKTNTESSSAAEESLSGTFSAVRESYKKLYESARRENDASLKISASSYAEKAEEDSSVLHILFDRLRVLSGRTGENVYADQQEGTAEPQETENTSAADSGDLFDLAGKLRELDDREIADSRKEAEEKSAQDIESILRKLSDAKEDEDQKEVDGPNIGFVDENTSVVTFIPGSESSEDLLLRLTEIRNQHEKILRAEAKAENAAELAEDISAEIGALQAGESVRSNDEFTETEVVQSTDLPPEDLARELTGLFAVLNGKEDPAADGKWSAMQRKALIRTGIAELLGGKVVFGSGTLRKGRRGAQKEVELRAYCLGITAALQELLPLNPLITDEMRQYLSRFDMSNPSVLADCAASLTRAENKELQKVLDTIAVLPRLKLSFELISRELSAAKLQDQIKVSVAEKIQKRQREFFLKEQLQEIKTELGLSADEKTPDIEKFTERMSKLNPPEHIQKRFKEELNKLSLLDTASPEYGVTANYLDTLTTVPWGKMCKEKFDLKRARKILDQDHEGLQDVKDRIIEFLAVGALKGQTKGQIMLFAGPPGVGKTSIGKSIAKALGRPFYRLSLGGIDDVSEIKGHRKTYVGAMPGKILNALRETQVMNPVIMLDEIDKLGRSYKGDPDSALLETLDPEQNSNFLDIYLDEKTDLSNCLFICTANNTDTISPPLLDRMDPIRLSGYIAGEKFAIARKHLIPRALENAGIKNKRTLQIPDDTLRSLIEGYARESGVRSLERAIARLIRKAAVKLVEGEKQIRISSDDLEEYLGTAPFKREKLLQGTGIMTGLAWTASGGVTLPVESVITSSDTAGFKLTGSLGDVMKESAGIALSFIQSHAERYTDKKTAGFFRKKTVHLHVPEGAIPKDGPSAGVTMATSLLSLALNTAPKSGFAMTGELTLTGQVLPIGGLREKVIAARRAGIFDIIIPIGNEGDVKELPEQVRQDVTFYYADTFDDVAYTLFDSAASFLKEHFAKEAPETVTFKEQTEEEKKEETVNAKKESKTAKEKAAAERGNTATKKKAAVKKETLSERSAAKKKTAGSAVKKKSAAVKKPAAGRTGKKDEESEQK